MPSPSSSSSDPASTDTHRREWQRLGRTDPLWAVLSRPERKYGSWEEDTAGFLDSGRLEVDHDLALAREVVPDLSPDRILDFGCGAGRTTRALARHGRLCVGVDISESMLAAARSLSAADGPTEDGGPRTGFLLADTRGLRSLRDGVFDLVYSRYVLQHLPDRDAIAAIVSELGRTLRPGGALVFQLPDRLPWQVRLQPRRSLYRLLRRIGLGHEALYWKLGLHPMRMRAVPGRVVRDWIAAAGCDTLAVHRRTDPGYGYRDALYVAVRSANSSR